jgi:hypothetical protein
MQLHHRLTLRQYRLERWHMQTRPMLRTTKGVPPSSPTVSFDCLVLSTRIPVSCSLPRKIHAEQAKAHEEQCEPANHDSRSSGLSQVA